MTITIHRGTDQIGGCVTEYESNGWRLFVDFGEQLPGSKKTGALEIEGLSKGDISKSALLITHYHGDHIGCIKELPKELPIYMGKLGRDIQNIYLKHISNKDKSQKVVIEMLNEAHCFIPGDKFDIGPFNITAINIDHSAFDAYAFRIEADGVSVYHTGDFRTHGFRSRKIDKLLKIYANNIDYVVCEGTNVSRKDATSMTERELQTEFQKYLKQKKSHIVYLSSTNIDRLFSFYHAALRAEMPFFVDSYQKRIMDEVVNSGDMWTKSELYQYGAHKPKVLSWHFNEIFINTILHRGCVLIARSKQKFDDAIEKLPGEKQKYLSMWNGYVDKTKEAYNEKLAQSLGTDYIELHTSGHIDMSSMHEVLRLLNPKAIIPIHTDNPDAFAKLFGDEWNVVLLKDGESIDCSK